MRVIPEYFAVEDVAQESHDYIGRFFDDISEVTISKRVNACKGQIKNAKNLQEIQEAIEGLYEYLSTQKDCYEYSILVFKYLEKRFDVGSYYDASTIELKDPELEAAKEEVKQSTNALLEEYKPFTADGLGIQKEMFTADIKSASTWHALGKITSKIKAFFIHLHAMINKSWIGDKFRKIKEVIQKWINTLCYFVERCFGVQTDFAYA
jgi:response regulator RpfG family c-di-GMP phosphodiesterase